MLVQFGFFCLHSLVMNVIFSITFSWFSHLFAFSPFFLSSQQRYHFPALHCVELRHLLLQSDSLLSFSQLFLLCIDWPFPVTMAMRALLGLGPLVRRPMCLAQRHHSEQVGELPWKMTWTSGVLHRPMCWPAYFVYLPMQSLGALEVFFLLGHLYRKALITWLARIAIF